MQGEKIAQLNAGIRDALPAVIRALETHPEIDVRMSAIKFGTKAEWHLGPMPEPIESFQWTDVQAEGSTALGDALRLLGNELSPQAMPKKRGLPPVCVLISDGLPFDPVKFTDGDESEKTKRSIEDYHKALEDLLGLAWGKESVRVPIAVGEDSNDTLVNVKLLNAFSSNSEVGVLRARNARELASQIKTATVTATLGAAEPGENRPAAASTQGAPPHTF